MSGCPGGGEGTELPCVDEDQPGSGGWRVVTEAAVVVTVAAAELGGDGGHGDGGGW